MATVTFGRVEQISSGEIETLDPRRSIDIEEKQQVVSEFLKSNDYDALLLQRPNNFAWFTTGGDNSRLGSQSTIASLFITPESRVLLADNVDSGQTFDREVSGLGFLSKERPWHESKEMLIEDLCCSRKVASDTGFRQTDNVSPQLSKLRSPLTVYERERIRDLGRLVSHAVEATARTFVHGQTEAEIAGQLSHRLIKAGVLPERLQVWADGQGHRYRHWSYGNESVERYCTLTAVGRREGLCAGCSRTVSFGDPPEVARTAHRRALLMQATGMCFSIANWQLYETWSRVQRIYEKFGYPEEWQLADQGSVIGYEVCEELITPESQYRLQPGTPVYWHPSVGPALVSDTILVGDQGSKLLTRMEDWPKVKIDIKGAPIYRPDILKR
ncbi:MAG: peptidase M24 [Planctomycetaceae bacterium]|nr:peptidase M24 [Planctomycetaceae bacterium]